MTYIIFTMLVCAPLVDEDSDFIEIKSLSLQRE